MNVALPPQLRRMNYAMHKRLILSACTAGLLGLLLMTAIWPSGGISGEDARRIAIRVVMKRIKENPEMKYRIGVSLSPERDYWRVDFFRMVEGNWHPDECCVYVHRHSCEAFLLPGE